MCKKSHAYFQYACNICAKFQIECLKTLRGADYTILLSLTESKPQNCLSRKCRNFVKNYFFGCKKLHAHLQHPCNTCAKFQIDCFKTLGGLVTQTCCPILKPNLKTVQVQNAVILSKIIFLLAKSHMHIFNTRVTSKQSFKLIA